MLKVKLHLKSFNKKCLMNVLEFINAKYVKSKNFQKKVPFFKVAMLNTYKQKYTVLKSPHVHKKSREQFELTEYHQLVLFKPLDPANKMNWSILFTLLKSGVFYGVQFKTSVSHSSFFPGKYK